ncbi:MAG: hypothetical protein HY924_16365 [Elusimicrobia bacterium]|nr:hypothetical protein [Elusimicrobiota bacterium]
MKPLARAVLGLFLALSVPGHLLAASFRVRVVPVLSQVSAVPVAAGVLGSRQAAAAPVFASTFQSPVAPLFSPSSLPTPAVLDLQPTPGMAALPVGAEVENAARVPDAHGQARAIMESVSAFPAAQTDPVSRLSELSRAFDNWAPAAAAPVEVGPSLDFAGTPHESLKGADRSLIQAQRAFRKELSLLSRGGPLAKAQADSLIQRALELGVPIRLHPSDLQAENNHWVRGPHIHVGALHIPVEAGYVPTLLPGYINQN